MVVVPAFHGIGQQRVGRFDMAGVQQRARPLGEADIFLRHARPELRPTFDRRGTVATPFREPGIFDRDVQIVRKPHDRIA